MYLSWWLSAMLLSSVTILFWVLLRRPLGVSGSWARVVMWRDDQARDEAEEPFRDNPGLFKDALMAATIDEFGREAVMAFMNSRQHGAQSVEIPQTPTPPPRTRWTVHLAFLLMLVAGGLLVSLFTGRLQISLSLGELHTHLFGSGLGHVITLFTGGMLVGFGTQMAGGCTSGHGLSGFSRFVPASMIATVTFFMTAIVVSLVLHIAAGGVQ